MTRITTVMVAQNALSGGFFVPKPSTDVGCHGCGMPDLASTVRRRPLASTSIGGDCYSLGFSVARGQPPGSPRLSVSESMRYTAPRCFLYSSRMVYPLWSYFPRNMRPPSWAISFVEVVQGAEAKISTVERKTGLGSDAVLSELGPGLLALGYAVESGKTHAAKIRRPVLFGENGNPEVNYEIDAFHDDLGIAVAVEAGRGAAGNADYRDIVRTSLILDARNMALLLPARYLPHNIWAAGAGHSCLRKDTQPAGCDLRVSAAKTAVRGCLAHWILIAVPCRQVADVG